MNLLADFQPGSEAAPPPARRHCCRILYDKIRHFSTLVSNLALLRIFPRRTFQPSRPGCRNRVVGGQLLGRWRGGSSAVDGPEIAAFERDIGRRRVAGQAAVGVDRLVRTLAVARRGLAGVLLDLVVDLGGFRQHHPKVKVHYVVQAEMRGQSDALYLARQHLTGPMIMAFADTLIETDFSFLKSEPNDALAWVKAVPDPRRFGVTLVDEEGWVTRLIEKPTDMHNNLAVVGCYYFKEGEALVAAIEEQMRRGIRLHDEFYLADAVNIMLERGAQMRTHAVDVWLDAGTPESLLETNRYLLEHGRDNSALFSNHSGTVLIPPVYIHAEASAHNAIIGPYVSMSARLPHSGQHRTQFHPGRRRAGH